MTTEEKAKAYDEALERAKLYHRNELAGTRQEMTEYIFPELRESENGRVRIALIKMISDIDGGYPFEKYGITKKDALNWLEKQKDAFENGRQLGIMQEQTRQELELEKQKGQNPVIFNEPYNPDEYEVIMEGNAIILKRKAERSEDEIHRKWILEYLYDGLRKTDEQFKDQFRSAIDWFEKQKGKDLSESSAYALLSKKGYVILERGDYNELCERAEKNQGFASDELQKSFEEGQKSIVSDPEKYGLCKVGEWSEEDEKILHAIEWHVGQLDRGETINGFSSSDMLRVLKSVRPQWSEEDEKMYNSALWHIKNSCGNGGKNSGEFDVYQWFKNRVKSLRPSWKPSEEQMEALDVACSGKLWYGEIYLEGLKRIREQLRKLCYGSTR